MSNNFIFLLLFMGTVADPQSLFEEKESLEEKLAVREYELRLAQEDLLNLKTELLKKADTNLDESRGKGKCPLKCSYCYFHAVTCI